MDRKIKDILYEDKFLQICQQTAKFAKLIQKHKKILQKLISETINFLKVNVSFLNCFNPEHFEHQLCKYCRGENTKHIIKKCKMQMSCNSYKE